MKITDIGIPNKYWVWIAAGIIILISSISVYIRATEVLHPEGDAYLVDHLSSRPYISKILCPHLIDAQDYEARPVSHFFENIDAHIFYISYLMGNPIFISLCTTAMLIILSAAIWICATKYAGIHPAAATLMTALLWTNPNVFFAGALYRDAKIATTFFLTLAVLYSYRFIVSELLPRFRDFAVIFSLSLLACLSDPQGVAFAIMLTGILLVWAFFTRSRQAWLTFVAGMCSLLVYLFFSKLLLPELVARYTWFNTHSTFTNFL